MKRRILLLSLGVIFVGCLITSLAKAQDDDQPGNFIYYEKNGFVWQTDLLAGMKFKLFKGHMPKLSPNGMNLAYYNKNMRPAIYTLETENNKAIYKATETANRQPVWSPSGKYLVVCGHTSTNVMYSVITMSGKEKIAFNAIGDVSWINDKELVYTSMHEVGEPRPRGDGGGNAFGITKVNVKTGKETVLLTPAQLIDYRLFDVKGGKIRLVKTEVTEQADWTTGNWTETYWKMNKNGKNLKEISELKTWEEKIAAKLPNVLKDYSVVDYGAFMNTKWRLFTLRKDYKADPVIYIMHYPHKDTLNKIVKGDFPTW